jgi:membrane-associated phospholipid phosphatase
MPAVPASTAPRAAPETPRGPGPPPRGDAGPWEARKSAFARAVSNVFSPPILAVMIALIGASFVAEPGVWRYVAIFALLGVLVPLLDVVWLLRVGRIGDFHLSQRHERTRPFVVSTAATFLVTGVLVLLSAPPLLVALAAAALVQTLVLFAITLRWQVSIHSATAGAFATISALVWGVRPPGLAGLMILPLVGWARVNLQRHTPAQVIVGAAIGAAVVLVFTRGLLW